MRPLEFFANLSEKFDKNPSPTFFATVLFFLMLTIITRVIYDTTVPIKNQVIQSDQFIAWPNHPKNEYGAVFPETTDDTDTHTSNVHSLYENSYIQEYMTKPSNRPDPKVEHNNNNTALLDSVDFDKVSVKTTQRTEAVNNVVVDTNYKSIK